MKSSRRKKRELFPMNSSIGSFGSPNSPAQPAEAMAANAAMELPTDLPITTATQEQEQEQKQQERRLSTPLRIFHADQIHFVGTAASSSKFDANDAEFDTSPSGSSDKKKKGRKRPKQRKQQPSFWKAQSTIAAEAMAANSNSVFLNLSSKTTVEDEKEEPTEEDENEDEVLIVGDVKSHERSIPLGNVISLDSPLPNEEQIRLQQLDKAIPFHNGRPCLYPTKYCCGEACNGMELSSIGESEAQSIDDGNSIDLRGRINELNDAVAANQVIKLIKDFPNSTFNSTNCKCISSRGSFLAAKQIVALARFGTMRYSVCRNGICNINANLFDEKVIIELGKSKTLVPMEKVPEYLRESVLWFDNNGAPLARDEVERRSFTIVNHGAFLKTAVRKGTKLDMFRGDLEIYDDLGGQVDNAFNYADMDEHVRKKNNGQAYLMQGVVKNYLLNGAAPVEHYPTNPCWYVSDPKNLIWRTDWAYLYEKAPFSNTHVVIEEGVAFLVASRDILGSASNPVELFRAGGMENFYPSSDI